MHRVLMVALLLGVLVVGPAARPIHADGEEADIPLAVPESTLEVVDQSEETVTNPHTRTIRIVLVRVPARCDIKPGSDPNSINLRSRGNIPFGVFGDSITRVDNINRATVRFNRVGILSIGKSPEDLNRDGRMDQVYHVDSPGGLVSGQTSARMDGRYNSAVFLGQTVRRSFVTRFFGVGFFCSDSVRTLH